MTHSASTSRYDGMPYRRCGASGLTLPAISLGLWHNDGPAYGSAEELKAIDHHAVDGGITLWQRPSTDQRP